MVGNAAIAAGLAFVAERVDVPPVAQRAFAVAVALLLAATAAAAFSRYGGPVTLADRGYTAFKAPAPRRSGDDLNQRLLSFSGNGRADLWGLAWDDAKRHSVLGAGAGTYERYFLAHQPSDVGRVRDAHGLYIETLAEVGPVGLALLIVVLLTPLVGSSPCSTPSARAASRRRLHRLPRSRRGRLGLGAAGRDFGGPPVWRVDLALRKAMDASATAVLPDAVAGRGAQQSLLPLFAAIALLGNSALSRSETAREQGKPARAAADARRARSLMPWSPRPWEALGRAQVAAGLPARRHA